MAPNAFSDVLYQLQQIHPINRTSVEAMEGIFQRIDVEKNDIFLKEGQICRHLFFIRSGLIRIFYYKNQKDITEWIAQDKEMFFSIESFYKGTPSRLQFHALESCRLIGIPRDPFMALCARYHDIETLHRKLVTLSLLLSQQRMDSIQFESAAERYKSLLTQRPEMIQRVPLTYIASFLGVTLETLSRIRAKMII
jgi:CRP-like cAMP-binding protein